jgi:hypothetical protein
LENQLEFRRWLGRDFERFERSNQHKLQTLLHLLSRELGDELGIKPWGRQRLYFNEFNHDNLYFEIGRDELSVFLVCGAASRDHDIQLREAINANRERFRALLGALQEMVDNRISVCFNLSARFFAIIPAEFIWGLRDFPPFPEGFEAFVDAFTDPARNTGSRLSREQVKQLFAREIEAQGLGDFPTKVRPDYLQSLYFDIRLKVPRDMLIEKDKEAIVRLFREIFDGSREFLRGLNQLPAAGDPGV